MKKSLIALAVLAASGASFAQSSVTIYGIADVYLGSVNPIAPAGTNITQTKIDSGGFAGSRFGFKGSEDLGGGLKANFLLEQGFNIDNGSSAAAGQMFARQSYVGFSGGWGEVKLGKMWTAYDDINGSGNSGFDTNLSSNNEVTRSGGYNANPGNSVYYSSPDFGGISGALTYALGENKTAAVDAGSVVAGHIKYAGGPVFVALGYQTEKATGAATSGDFTRLTGSYDFGVAKVIAGFGKVAGITSTGAILSGAEINDVELGADFPIGKALVISGGFSRSVDNATAGDFTRTGYGIAAKYDLSKRTLIYGGYRSATSTKTGLVDTNGTLFSIGMNHSF